jgi:two-component system, response regulator PdtaR
MRSYLIVDDNLAMAENLAEIIRDRGDDAVVVGSGREALEQVKRRRFDAVLTDMRMPEMDGVELVREVRRSDPGVPAIVITAFFKDVGIRAARNEGPLAVLPKPVPVPQLLHLLGVAKRNGRVLLVEDDPILSDNLIEVLQERGFSVVRLKAVAEIEGLPADRPLLAVVDMRVPGGPDGEAARRLAERFAGMPILVATAYGDIPVDVAAQRLFRKPFDTGELLAAIESVHQGAEPAAGE